MAEVTAWNLDRNTAETTINWRCINADARIKLKHLYIRRSSRDTL
jgi:hypothetical protein